jgi:hypothetical protein
MDTYLQLSTMPDLSQLEKASVESKLLSKATLDNSPRTETNAGVMGLIAGLVFCLALAKAQTYKYSNSGGLPLRTGSTLRSATRHFKKPSSATVRCQRASVIPPITSALFGPFDFRQVGKWTVGKWRLFGAESRRRVACPCRSRIFYCSTLENPSFSASSN